jgi:hypothetical protein
MLKMRTLVELSSSLLIFNPLRMLQANLAYGSGKSGVYCMSRFEIGKT